MHFFENRFLRKNLVIYFNTCLVLQQFFSSHKTRIVLYRVSAFLSSYKWFMRFFFLFRVNYWFFLQINYNFPLSCIMRPEFSLSLANWNVCLEGIERHNKLLKILNYYSHLSNTKKYLYSLRWPNFLWI